MTIKRLMDILACPLCKGALERQSIPATAEHPKREEMLCLKDKIAFPIIDDIPQMIIEKARPLSDLDERGVGI